MSLHRTVTYAVCLGTDVDDPAPTVFTPAYRTKDAANEARERFASAPEDLDLVITPGYVFYIKPNDDTVSLGLGAADAASTIALIVSNNVSPKLYVQDDLDVVTHVLTLPPDVLQALFNKYGL